jgi:hypothetical protein
MPFAVKATNSVPQGKILLLGALAVFLLVVTVPILFRVDMPTAAANSTLKCYDNAGNYEPCSTRAGPEFNGETTEAREPPSWITTALYQQDSRATTVLYQQESRATAALDQPASWTISAPAARRSSTLRRPASATCRRRFIPCFFSALRKRLTHIASLAAAEARPRPAGEHL